MPMLIPVAMLGAVFIATTVAWNLARLIVSAHAISALTDRSRSAAIVVGVAIYLLQFLFAAVAGFLVAHWSSRLRPEPRPRLRRHLRDCALLYGVLLVVVAGWLPWHRQWALFLDTWAVAALAGLVGDAGRIILAGRPPVARAV